jgi:hypothetical protein
MKSEGLCPHLSIPGWADSPQFGDMHIIVVDSAKILEMNELLDSYPRFGVQNIQNKGPRGKIFHNKDLATSFSIWNGYCFRLEFAKY